MKRIAWVSAPTEIEFDIASSFVGTKDTLDLYWTPRDSVGFDEPRDLARFGAFWFGTVAQLPMERLRSYDLVVVRHPSWWTGDAKPLPNMVAYCSEQGPVRHYATSSSARFEKVAVTSRADLEWFRREYPGKRVFCAPFGCARTPPRSPGPKSWPLLADGCPHYACGCDGGDKRVSVETMVLPVTSHQVVAYGWGEPKHGWPGVPDVSYRGTYVAADYAGVYDQARIYLGISWNWRQGGYGVKLARALATGIPVVWHRSLGMEDEGLVVGDQLEVSSTPEETQRLVSHLLSHDAEREEMGARGRAWALEHWNWHRILTQLAEEAR